MPREHEVRAPVICCHDGTLAVLAYDRVYLKVSEALLLVHYIRSEQSFMPNLTLCKSPPDSLFRRAEKSVSRKV